MNPKLEVTLMQSFNGQKDLVEFMNALYKPPSTHFEDRNAAILIYSK